MLHMMMFDYFTPLSIRCHALPLPVISLMPIKLMDIGTYYRPPPRHVAG